MSLNNDGPLTFGPYELDLRRRVVLCHGAEVPLTHLSFECLVLLFRRAGTVVTYEDFNKEVWKEPHARPDDPSFRHKVQVAVGAVSRAFGRRRDGKPWIKAVSKHGYLLDHEPTSDTHRSTKAGASTSPEIEKQLPVGGDAIPGGRDLPESLRVRIDELLLSPGIAVAVRRVLAADSYPMMMALSTESVISPIWRLIPADERARLSSAFSPFGPMPPRIMHLDIFLLRADDTRNRPYLLNYFSGKPVTGWQAFMMPFRHKRPGESESTRQAQNSTDIASFLGMNASDIQVKSLGDQFVVSVKPDPGYSELVTYIFEFCWVLMKTAPNWLRSLAPEMQLRDSVRRFHWFHPEEMEAQERSMLVDGDVIRGIHYFFGTTLPEVPVGFPARIPN